MQFVKKYVIMLLWPLPTPSPQLAAERQAGEVPEAERSSASGAGCEAGGFAAEGVGLNELTKIRKEQIFMKLIFAIVNNDDSQSVQTAVTENGFQVTKLASSGGFLKAGNTTFMMAVDDSRVDDLIEVIRKHSRKRKQLMTPVTAYDAAASSYGAFPVEVSIGGATIIITNIDRFEKV